MKLPLKEVKSRLARAGVKHFSPSQLNTYIASPTAFLMRYLGYRGEGNAATFRGQAVEAGCDYIADGNDDLEGAIKLALEFFDEKTVFLADPKKDEERENIAGMVEQAHPYLLEYGVTDRPPEGRNQLRVMLNLEGVIPSIMGFVDYMYADRTPDRGLIVDLKTSKRLPAKAKDTGQYRINAGHIRQGATYHAYMTQTYDKPFDVIFLYVTPEKSLEYKFTDDNLQTGLSQIHRAALSAQRLVTLSPNLEDVALSLFPDQSSFYLNDIEEGVNKIYSFENLLGKEKPEHDDDGVIFE